MGRTLKTVRAGEGRLEVDVVAGTTTVATVANFGHTIGSTVNGPEFILGAPEEGVEKRLTCLGITTTSVSVVFRGSTAATVTFEEGAGGAATQIAFASTGAGTVSLVGLSSVKWLVTNVHPDNVAANTTGIVIGTS